MTKQIEIRYGSDQILSLELSDDALIARGGSACGEPLEDVPAAAAAAVAAPIDYPPLVDATLPTDRVCLPVDRDVPQAARVIAGVLQPLFEAGVGPDQVTVVLAEEYPDIATVKDDLAAEIQDAIHVKRHNSRDGNGLAYLATTADGDSIQINRDICDADVVIPISCIRAEGPDGDWGQRGNVFPTFADAATREKYVTPWEVLSADQREKRKRGREEAAWLLGARLTLQVVSGGGDSVLHIVAGDVDSVGLRSRDLATTAWGLEVPRRAKLVVASLDGGEQQQTWENVSRAISGALRVVEAEDAAIVVCSELTEMPGPTMIRALIGAEEEYGEDGEPIESLESIAGGQLRETLGRMPIFLLSKLPEDVVLDLGMAFVEKATDINNLCRRYESCIVLANGQHVLPAVANDETANLSQ